MPPPPLRFAPRGRKRTMTKQRADRLLVARGLFESRARAQAAIAAGHVRADGVPVRKASEEISDTAVIEAAPEHPYVSRGGVKLAFALEHFALAVKDRVCLDVGASTGGFTEVLLAHGASARLRGRCGPRSASCRGCAAHDKIISMEADRHPRARSIAVLRTAGFCQRGREFHLAQARAAGGRKTAAAARHARCADQAAIRGGAPRHQKRHRARSASSTPRSAKTSKAFVTARGWRVGGIVPSPILGGDGNREFLLEAERG